MYVCNYVYVCMSLCMYMCTFICIYMYMCMCITMYMCVCVLYVCGSVSLCSRRYLHSFLQVVPRGICYRINMTHLVEEEEEEEVKRIGGYVTREVIKKGRCI